MTAATAAVKQAAGAVVSFGDLIAPMCRTAKIRRLSLPSIGDDHA
jgi:hypothetical protein